MSQVLLRSVPLSEVERSSRPPVDSETLRAAGIIVDRVRANGLPALRSFAERFGELRQGDPVLLGRAEMKAAAESIDAADLALLDRVACRIRNFSEAQMASIQASRMAVPGGEAGHSVEPVASAGCYAPGGRYPLPSSVLMTGVTARVAGCERVVIASPNSSAMMLAAAHVSGADAFLACGGAHGIAALSAGFEGFARVDVIVGPGNKWVTAAKQLVGGTTGIDMLAGPSELLVLADCSADPQVVAADLLAQAEHDTDAVPILVTDSTELADAVERALPDQLAATATERTARAALGNGFVCVVDDLDQGVDAVNQLAPEHLEIMTADAPAVAKRIRNAGAVFIGTNSAEVLGDYGIGPNHTLPTGGTSRFQAGLSVVHFLRLRTWTRVDNPEEANGVVQDAIRLAELEGLECHARSASHRVAASESTR